MKDKFIFGWRYYWMLVGIINIIPIKYRLFEGFVYAGFITFFVEYPLDFFIIPLLIFLLIKLAIFVYYKLK